ncbi:MAG: hypothetical protein KDC34_02465 [Saprospiraceae bacterium]|nr:hypothetical protein [Saprospiraceae bacterium]
MQGIIHYESVNSLENFGGKAAGLFFLRDQQFEVPAFYLLGYETVQAIIEKKAGLPELVDDWVAQHKINPDSLWAVRSSAHIEDGKEQSFAGLFSSEINKKPSQLPNAIENVITAYQHVQELKYNTFGHFDFAIIIQEMLRPDYAGVVFSHNPLNPEEELCYINIVPGLGETLVSGKAEAFMVTQHRKKRSFLNPKETFFGEQFAGDQTIEIEESGTSIQAAVNKHLDALYQGAQKLAKVKGFPVDIEFAIAGDILYWLQVRPITTPEKEIVHTIWDNSNINENYPGLSLPLSISYTQRTYGKGYSGMARFLGMTAKSVEQNMPLFQNMVGGIYGSLYYNVTAWQQLLYQLPFGKKTSYWITRIWNADDAQFRPPKSRSSLLGYLRLNGNLIRSFLFFKKHKMRFEKVYYDVLTNFSHEQLENKSQEELVSYYFDLEKRLGDNWVAPLLNGFYALILFSTLKKVFRNSRLFESYPNFINDMLYAQGDVVSVQIVKDFQKLIVQIQEDSSLKLLFQADVSAKLLESLPTTHPEFWKDVSTYLDQFGERAPESELKMETRNYRDDPVKFIEFLKTNAGMSFDQNRKSFSFDYKEVIRKAYKNNPLKRIALIQLIRVSIPRIRDRENYRFLRTKSFHIVRQLFRAIGNQLYLNGKLESASDFLYLNFEELIDPAIGAALRDRVSQRKLEYKSFENQVHAPRYAQTESGLHPVEKSAAKFAKGTLSGTGCCSGIITAKTVIITGSTMDIDNIAGKIFIANHFEPGWINLFTQAAGVISERGNLLSHTAILCREMGIPSIVGVKGLMDSVKEGDVVQMNGGTGEVVWV